MSSTTDDQDALLQKLRDLIEHSGEKEDTLGSEMADDARVWKVYSKAARKHDKELLDQWNGTLDTLLIFAGLFSAVSTTFIIDSYKQMQPDYAQETFRLLLANVSGTQYVERSGRVEESARAVNCLWISSLIASLSTALIAILAKQWLASYPVSDRENLREWAQLRQYRFDALERWHVPVLIAVVPVLLHLSLMLFLAGLVVFLWDIDTGTMVLALVLSAATYGLYGFTTISPVLWSSSPFRTPLTPVLQRTAHQSVDCTAGAIYRLYRMAERVFVRDVLAALACRTSVPLSSPEMSTIYRLRNTTVHAVTRSVATVYFLVIDPIYQLYCMLIRVVRRCVDSCVGKLVAVVMGPTGFTLYTLAICAILCFMAVQDVTRLIIELCSMSIDTIRRLCCFFYTAVHSLICNTLHWLARSISSRQRPSALPIDPWITQTAFSSGISASALSWLGLNAETSDIYYAVVYGLGDANRGVTVADDLAPPMKTRISVQTTDLISTRASGDLGVMVTHLRAAYHLRNLLPTRDVDDWTYYQVQAVKHGRTKLRTERDYDTLLRISTTLEKTVAYGYLALFFGCRAGQEACESPASIIPSTVYAIARLCTKARKPNMVFRRNVLAILNTLRYHLVESTDLTAKLLKSSFSHEEWSIECDGSLRANPPHDCGRPSCDAMTYLAVILTCHDFESSMASEVRRSLKARTFETFVFFCRRFSPSQSCEHFKSSLTLWLSRDDPFSKISLCGRDIASFVPWCASLSPHTRMRMVRHLLHPDQSWCTTDSSDIGRDDGLKACLLSIANVDIEGDLDLPDVRILLDDACLEPLQRAPDWTDYSLLGLCAAALVKAGNYGYDVEDLVSKFIFTEAKGGPNGTSTRTWDLVVAGSQNILASAEMADAGYVREFCRSLGKLRQRYPDNACWKKMGDSVRHGASFVNDPRWRTRKSEYATSIRKVIEEFCSVMDPKDGRPQIHSWGRQRSGTDGSDIDTNGDPAYKFLEWQVDGAY